MRALALTALFGAALCARPADVFKPLDLRQVKVAGEIGRRIDVTIQNNLMVLDAPGDFLAPFEAKQKSGGYIGLGKLILSAVRFAAYSGDPKVIAFKDNLVRRTLATQGADGYIGFFEPKARVSALWDVHEIGYIIAGLLDDYRLFQNRPSLDAAIKAADYLLANWGAIPPDWEQRTGVAPHVSVTGIERTMLALHRATGDRRYLDFVLGPRALESWDLPIVVGRREGIAGHIYAYMARSLAQLELFRLRPDPRLTAQAGRAIEFLTHGEGMAITGGAGQWEIWTDDQDGRGSLAESCATAYQLRVYDSLLRLRGEGRYGDLMERTIFNTLFAAQSPDGRRIRYYSPLEGPREYHPGDTYCCPGNYRRIVSELPEMVYYRAGNGIAVNLYTASTATVEAGGAEVRLRQQTDFPNSGAIKLEVEPSRPATFELHLRIPAWAAGATVRVNGEPSPRAAAPGAFAVMAREWRAGDRVRIDLPMPIRLVRGRQQQAGRVAVMRGPLVYALNPAQNAELAKLDAADLSRYVLDPASIALVSDASVRPAGTAVRAGAWRPGYGTQPKHDLQLTLTEFPDPDARATYFRLRDLAPAVEDELTAPARR
jgi:DUF1680 family protein